MPKGLRESLPGGVPGTPLTELDVPLARPGAIGGPEESQTCSLAKISRRGRHFPIEYAAVRGWNT
jgi:hypothetical protein